MSLSGSRFPALIVAAGGALVLTGCGSGDDASSHASSSSGSAKASASAPVSAADGTDLKACADGRCEVRVGPSARIPLPRRLGVKSVSVQSVNATAVTLVGREIGNGGSSSGSGNVSVEARNGRFQIKVGLGSEAIENGLDIFVVALQDEYAVLRISPS